MKYALKDFTLAIETILRDEKLKTVTLFCAPLSKVKERIRVSRKAKTPNELVVTFGKPNYAEREFLKLCKKAKTNPRKLWLKYKK